MEPKIGAYIIARNNAETIELLLQRLDNHFDEIAVVDTGSTDRTVEIATRYALVQDYEYPDDWKHPFLDDFGKARNQAMDLVGKWVDWVVWFDTDDTLDESSLINLREAITREDDNPDVDVIACHYVMNTLTGRKGRTIRMAKNRAWRVGCGRWTGRIHEQPNADDKKTVLYMIDFNTFHSGESPSKRNLTIFEDMVEKGDVGLDQWFDMAREYKQINDWENCKKYITMYIDECNKLPTLLVGETRSRQKFLSLAYHYRSLCWFNEKDMKRSREDAFMGIMVDDSVPHNFIQVGWIHANRRLYKRAIPWFMHAYNVPKLGAHNVDFHGMRTFTVVGAISLCYLRLGEKKKALKYYEIGLRNDPDDRWMEQHEELQELKDENG
ncbi:glycosyltransferase [Candidatus Pacearchaeota archaeon]|nr:glycosyltransferase [Candidatus Pacearchaeota archaeon]